MKRDLLFTFQLLCASFALSACAAGYPPAYSAESIEARVIDAESKQPLEGVIVTADWELRGGGLALGGSSYAGELMVMEAVTDKSGRLYFPAWGPIRQSKGELHNHDPRLILFKPGYRYEILSNKPRYEAEAALEPVRRSQWNGRTIEMKRFIDRPMTIGPYKYETSAYAEHLSFLNTSLETIVMDDCNWKKIPRMLLALKDQKDVFRKQGIRFSLIGADYVPTNPKECGTPEEFFRNYRP